MSDLKTVKITGELFWCKWMSQFNTAFNEANDRYECTIGNISDNDIAQLTSLGIKVKYKESMGNFIVAKSKYLFKPEGPDGKGIEVDALGNGSKCIAIVSAYKHKLSAKHGNAPSIQKIKVTEVKTYVPDAKEVEEDVPF
jgi:hypothetical protein